MKNVEMYELTNPQKIIWNMENYFGNTPINNICTPAIIYTPLNKTLLEKAINNVVKKNDNFRIQIALENGTPMQYVSEYKPFNLEFIHIKDEIELKKIEEDEAIKKFDLQNSSLYRFKIAVLDNNSFAIILTVHHLIADSWALGLVIKNILDEYYSIIHREAPKIQNYSYLDYIHSEQNYKSSEKYQKDKAFWHEVFKTIPEQATIPSSSINPVQTLGSTNNTSSHSHSVSSNANRLTFEINKHFTQSLKDFCAKQNISLFNLLMAVFSVYISSVSGKDDFVIGTPILNRTGFREKHTLGMFVNMAPVRINTDQNLEFTEFARKIASNLMGVLRHQKYSYSQVLEDLHLSNLYNTLISYQITKAYDKEYGAYKTDWVFSKHCSGDFNIHIMDINDTGSLNISYDYLVDKYSSKDVENIHSRIKYILEQVLEKSEIKINEIEIITKEEKNKIINSFNNTKVDYPKSKNIVYLFEEQVKKEPNKKAIVFENASLTYKELHERSNSLAHYLKSQGVAKKSIVGLFLDKSLESIVGILAVLKCECAYMPIDVDYPQSRIEYMLKDSNCSLILTMSHLENKLSSFDNVYSIDLDSDKIYATNTESLQVNSTADDLAYLMYTSGSTGNPKGVLVSNKNIVRLVKNPNYIKFEKNERILQTGSIVFDACTFEIWGALLNGFELYIIKKQDLLDPILLKEYLDSNKITVLWITAPLFNQLSEQDPSIFSTPRVLLTGGDVLSCKHINSVKKACPNLTIINGYGPTENTTFSTCFTINKMYNSSIPIGYPISNSTCYIVSNKQKLLPVGVPGELLVGGDGVSKGYLNNEKNTKEKFISNIFGDGLLYKTGDLAYWNEDGSISFIGRIDNQVKIRGFRVELNEINLALQKLDYIKECFTVVKTINKEKVLCTYFSSSKNADVNSIKDFLKKELPKFAVPTYLVQMESLPINVNGKIDKNKLPEPKVQNSNNTIINARNETDKKLIDILKDLLNCTEALSIADDFFELGGDSLSAITLAARIQQEFNVQIYVKDILENSQVMQISDTIAKSSQAKDVTPTIMPIQKANCYETSSSQKRIFFSCKLAGANSTVYNIPGGVILEGNIDVSLLEKCIVKLINRHEAFRTYFEVENECVVQKICDDVNFSLDITQNAEYDDIDALFSSFVKPFDLSKAPLFRAQFIQFTNGKSAIFIDMHHIISDGTSLAIFTDELCRLYNGESLPDLKITFKDYAKYENELLSKGELKEAEEYWLNQFSQEIPVLNLPTKGIRSALQTFKGKKMYASIDEELSKKIVALSNKLNITPYMFLLSCYYILLSKYSSQDDIVVGSPVFGRELLETYTVIGMFVNTLALRAKINETSSFKDFVESVKTNLLNAYKYQSYPFDELIEQLSIKRDPSRNPLFDTMFIYQNNGYKDVKFDDILFTYYIPDTSTSKFDLSLEVVASSEKYNLCFEYNTSLFDKDFIKRLSSHYLNIVSEVIDNALVEIRDIKMISNDEQNIILYGFNNTFRDYDKEKNIVELFEEQVVKTPDNAAIVCNNSSLSFKELNEKSNSLAYILRKKENIKPNDLVGIMVNRSLEMIVAILAVIKSGGACIPIDPTFPKERIDYMLSTSKAKVLLTTKALEKTVNFENTLNIDLSDSNLYSAHNKNLHNVNTPEDLAYIIFTSGSTGRPKGVMLKHSSLANLANYCNSYVDYLKNDEPLSVLSITTISFDIFIFEAIISLQKGHRVIIANDEEQNSLKLLNSLIKTYNVKVLQCTPSRMQILINNIDEISALKQLDYIILAGEPIPLSLVNKLHDLVGCTIYNGYGPSETTVFSTLTKLENGIITLGQPLYNTQIYILDNNLHLVPIGVPGEIYIAGDGVAKGYLNNPELTKKSFIENPFRTASIMYKSGDLGMYTEKGEIICLGRCDNQVKIRGQRIELEGIEALITKYSSIEKALVLKQTINSREYLFAYYVAKTKINKPSLKKYLASKLPKYMVPSYFVDLKDFPYTPNGKIDRKALPLPANILSSSKEQYIKPKTWLQKKLASLFEDILDASDIGINDNFFELGGDSLSAMVLNMKLSSISKNVSYQDIFKYPTIAELEEKIISKNKNLEFKKIENLSGSLVDVLRKCTKKDHLKKYKPQGVLITGATGFLGIHIVKTFLKKSNANIYCIVRDNQYSTSKARLYKKLNYYFGGMYNDLIDKRIFVITGDTSLPAFGLGQDELLGLSSSVDLVINCAANVAHFGNYSDFYKSNVTSVKHIIDFCKSFNKKLYHVSTISVAGSKLDLSYPSYKKTKKVEFKESSLYVGQILDLVYSRTKFEAECLVLNAINNGLDGYILRMGHLTPRLKDGVFQKNVLGNDFVLKVLSFAKLGYVPDYLLNYEIEFTPVDCAALTTFKIITHPTNNNRIFNLFNPNFVSAKKLIKLFKTQGYSFNVLDEAKFVEKVKGLMDDTSSEKILTNLMNDFDNNLHLDYTNDININSKFTNRYLMKTYFLWPKISNKYLYRFIKLILKEM